MPRQAYSDSKLFDAVLVAAVARLRPDVLSNAVEPGWVATKMGGPGASDDLSLGPVTQAWLAVSDDPEALVSGGYFYHQRRRETNPAVHDRRLQDDLLAACGDVTGVRLPRPVRNDLAALGRRQVLKNGLHLAGLREGRRPRARNRARRRRPSCLDAQR